MSIEEALESAVERALEKFAGKLGSSQQRLLNREAAARYIGSEPKQIDRLRDAGELKVVRWEETDKKRPRPFFDVRDLDALIEKYKRREGI